MTNSTVVAQCESSTTTPSYSSTSNTSRRSRSNPGTSEISRPSLSARRSAAGSMIVGTCDSRPAPTTSPMVGPPARREHAVFDVAVEVEAPGAALAADARLARTAEGRAQVADEEAVHPHRARDEPAADPLGARPVGGEHGGGKAVARVVRSGDGLVLGIER